jgi:hypothetical protein
MRYSKTRKGLADRIRELRSLIKISIQQLNEGSPLSGYFLVTYTEQLINLKKQAKIYQSYRVKPQNNAVGPRKNH